MKARRGFALIELLIALTIVSILARIAVPAYQEYVRRARATQAVGDVRVVRQAAFQYAGDNAAWPPDVNRGVIPPGMEQYLPAGFTFQRNGYLLDWDYWVLPDGLPSQPSTGVLVGVSLVTQDARLGNAFLDLFNTAATYTIGDHYTLIIEGV